MLLAFSKLVMLYICILYAFCVISFTVLKVWKLEFLVEKHRKLYHRQFMEEEIRMTDKCMKEYSTSLKVRKIQIRTRYSFSHLSGLQDLKSDNIFFFFFLPMLNRTCGNYNSFKLLLGV